MLSRTLFFSLLLQSFSVRAQTPQLQVIPQSPPAPGSFSNGAAILVAEPPMTDQLPSDIYGARSIDLPFYRLYHGNMNFFNAGELNTPTGTRDAFGSENDNANQSACGIPDNAFFISKVAIHPYFLKFADLSRYCMQDVCISFWKADGSSDMMLKVTDICSTDPKDPAHCASPSDIKIDRTKAKIMEGITDDNDPRISGSSYPDQIWWFFTKCWADGLAQPAYQGNNWFTTPPIPNNLNWSQTTAMQQYTNNQASYPAKRWSTYPNGGYNTERDSTISPPISDWVPGKEPAWSPLAGGVGWGKPISGAAAPAPAASSTQSSVMTLSTSTSSSSVVAVAAAASSQVAASNATSSTTPVAGPPADSSAAASSQSTPSTTTLPIPTDNSTSTVSSSPVSSVLPCSSVFPLSTSKSSSSAAAVAAVASSAPDASSTPSSAAAAAASTDASSSSDSPPAASFPTTTDCPAAVTVTVTQTFTTTTTSPPAATATSSTAAPAADVASSSTSPSPSGCGNATGTKDQMWRVPKPKEVVGPRRIENQGRRVRKRRGAA